MNRNPSLDPVLPEGASVVAIATMIVPHGRDLGGFEVRRALPAAKRQAVGAFIFFDDEGRTEFLTGRGSGVRRHPHVGPATVPSLVRGRIHHPESPGTGQGTETGSANLMTAGQGSTHSQRTDQGAVP